MHKDTFIGKYIKRKDLNKKENRKFRPIEFTIYSKSYNAGITEYITNWDIATELQKILPNSILSKDTQPEIKSYEDRCKVAIDNKCPIFISIHTNGATKPYTPEHDQSKSGPIAKYFPKVKFRNEWTTSGGTGGIKKTAKNVEINGKQYPALCLAGYETKITKAWDNSDYWKPFPMRFSIYSQAKRTLLSNSLIPENYIVKKDDPKI